jgi:hypothetical protein
VESTQNVPKFANIPLDRINTNASIVSGHSMHLVSMENDLNRGTEAKLEKLLNESNKIDNEFPYIHTNPLPDLVLDEMDKLFLLKPERGIR